MNDRSCGRSHEHKVSVFHLGDDRLTQDAGDVDHLEKLTLAISPSSYKEKLVLNTIHRIPYYKTISFLLEFPK